MVPLSLTSVDPGPVLDAWMAQSEAASLDHVELALTAWRLRLRDQFDDLLCLARHAHVRRLDYQVETVLKVLRTFRGRALLADEVGLGKTIEAGMLITEFLLRNMAQRVLVLVPAALVGQWEAELGEKFDIKVKTSESHIFRTAPERAWSDTQGVIVASPQMARSQRHAPLVEAQKWDLIVVDEAHHIKNRTTAGYKLVDALKSRYLLLLTATPVENSLDELYNLVTLLKPGQLATLAHFKKEFLARGDPFSPKNREKLRTLLAEVMVRNTRALAGRAIELPPRFAQTVVVSPSQAESALYEATLSAVRGSASLEPATRLSMRTLLEEAGSSAYAVLDSLMRSRTFAGLPTEIRAGLESAARTACGETSTKISRLIDIVRTLPILAGGSKAVVFSRFRATLDAISTAFDRAGIAYSVFHGGMTGVEKDESVARLRDEVNVMLASEVGGEGRNLQFANVLVNFDLLGIR